MKPPRVMFCNPSPADGYEPSAGPDLDATRVYLALAAEDIQNAIGHAGLANQDSRTDHLSLCVALDALRDALTAIEAEIEAANAQD